MINVSSIACCCANNSFNIKNILRRITPIEYDPGLLMVSGNQNDTCPSKNGTLLVDSNQIIYGYLAFPTCDQTSVGTLIDGNGISTNNVIGGDVYANNSVFVGQTQITSSGDTLELPAGTTVGGSPIGGSSNQFFQLPICPTNWQQTNLPITSAGDYIVGGYFQNGYLSYVQYVYYWPCLFAEDAIITSIVVYLNVAAEDGLSITANNFVVELRIRNQNGSIINTGQTVSYTPVVANNTSYYIAVKNLSYPVIQGQRAGLYINWDGQLASSNNYNYSWITYNIGYQPVS